MRETFEQMHQGRDLTRHHLRGTYSKPQIAALWNQHVRTWELVRRQFADTQLLAYLPIEHPLRNKPLIDIGAEYQMLTKGQMWHQVKPAYGIAQCTYNQLGPVWINNHVWRSTK